jgi:DNA-binding NarL/FixJ family response regulator
MTAKTEKKTPTAVVCDDDPMVRQLERKILSAAGYEVIAGCGTAVEALQLVLQYRPDVLLLDLGLPGASGETIIAPIQKAVPDCAVVVVSAFDASPAIAQGAIYVIPKGAPSQLQQMLEALLPAA